MVHEIECDSCKSIGTCGVLEENSEEINTCPKGKQANPNKTTVNKENQAKGLIITNLFGFSVNK